MTTLSWLLAPLLGTGAASFVVPTQAVTATLCVSLPPLLLVIGGIGTTAWWCARFSSDVAVGAA